MAWSMLEEIETHRKPMTAKELGPILNVHPKTLYKMAHRNAIPSVKLGDIVRFDPKSVSLWLRRKDPMLAIAAKSQAA